MLFIFILLLCRVVSCCVVHVFCVVFFLVSTGRLFFSSFFSLVLNVDLPRKHSLAVDRESQSLPDDDRS